jgi:heterodisulfide reductase subunit A-like polyferredoxin
VLVVCELRDTSSRADALALLVTHKTFDENPDPNTTCMMEVETTTRTVDVVIIGSGFAALAAAIEASNASPEAEIVLVEKMSSRKFGAKSSRVLS